MTETTTHPLIAHLLALADSQDRGALAALRRGLGQPSGTAPEMFRYVEPFLPQRRSQVLESAAYTVASLFAFHPKTTRGGNLGAHMAAARSQEGEDALERRFTALLAAHADDLPDFLRQAVSFLKSKEIPLDWNQLFWDIQHWDEDNRPVQKRWAASFWGRPSQENNQQNPSKS